MIILYLYALPLRKHFVIDLISYLLLSEVVGYLFSYSTDIDHRI